MSCVRMCPCIEYAVVDGRMPDGCRKVPGMPLIALSNCPHGCKGTGWPGGQRPASLDRKDRLP